MTSSGDLEDRVAIEHALLSYCRGIDRLDAGLVAAAFHPDAMLEGYGAAEPLSIGAFVARALASLGERFEATQHRLSNVTIEIHDDRALVESYVLAYHVARREDRSEGSRILMTFNGRYIDHFERREGLWLIARRHLRVDWSDISPMGEQMAGAYVQSGRGGSPDPVFS